MTLATCFRNRLAAALAVAAAVGWWAAVSGGGAEPPSREKLAADFPRAATSDLAKAEAVVRLPGVTIRGGERKVVELDGTVSLTEGILEFLAVEPDSREYESLFAVRAKPSALQFALLLIGCEPGPPSRPAKAGEKAGDRLLIEVEWQKDGRTQRAPAERFLVDRRTGKPAANLTWIFTGSPFVKDLSGREILLADAEQAFVSLWGSSSVPVNLGGDHGNPYQGDREGFEVNPATVPPKGTAVKLRFQKPGG